MTHRHIAEWHQRPSTLRLTSGTYLSRCLVPLWPALSPFPAEREPEIRLCSKKRRRRSFITFRSVLISWQPDLRRLFNDDRGFWPVPVAKSLSARRRRLYHLKRADVMPAEIHSQIYHIRGLRNDMENEYIYVKGKESKLNDINSTLKQVKLMLRSE